MAKSPWKEVFHNSFLIWFALFSEIKIKFIKCHPLFIVKGEARKQRRGWCDWRGRQRGPEDFGQEQTSWSGPSLAEYMGDSSVNDGVKLWPRRE